MAVRGLAAIERAGLSFDVFAYHTQLGELAEVARRHPGLPMIVNHIGGAIGIGPYAGRRDEVFSDWRAGMIELGRSANVRVKLSGLGMRVFGFGFGDRPQPPSSSDLATAWAPYIERDRDVRRRPLHVRQQLSRRQGNVQLPGAGERVQADRRRRVRARKHALFAGTARNVYRLATTDFGTGARPVDHMARRRIARTALEVPVLGFGGATLGDAPAAISEHQALAALEAGYAAGIDYFDTSPWYGNGKSELRFGAVLRDKPRASFILTTKVGRVYAKCTDPNDPSQLRWRGGLPFSPTFDYTRDGVLPVLRAEPAHGSGCPRSTRC